MEHVGPGALPTGDSAPGTAPAQPGSARDTSVQLLPKEPKRKLNSSETKHMTPSTEKERGWGGLGEPPLVPP